MLFLKTFLSTILSLVTHFPSFDIFFSYVPSEKSKSSQLISTPKKLPEKWLLINKKIQ